MTQEQLWNAWKQLQMTIESLGAVVQNDFERMIDDGTLTRQDVADVIPTYDTTCRIFEKRYRQLTELTRHYLVTTSKE